MRRAAMCFVAVWCVAATCGTVVWARGGNHPNDRDVGRDGWPGGLAGIINTKARVCGYFINAGDWFYFRGGTKAFNAFLAAYAKLKATPRRLVLHPGRCRAKAPWDKGEGTPCEWSVTVARRGRGASEMNTGEMSKYVATVHLWLGGDVALKDLDVPLNVDVESGREIETFVVEHQARQSLEGAPREKGSRGSVEPATEGRREDGNR